MNYIIKLSHTGQKTIELGPEIEPEYHHFLRHCIIDNWTKSPAYVARQEAHPFLQGRQDRIMRNGLEGVSHTENGTPTWTLVEFWSETPESFVDWLNRQVADDGTEFFLGVKRFYRGMI